MRRVNVLFLIVFVLMVSSSGYSASGKSSWKTAGLGFGGVSAWPVKRYPYALAGVIEGAYRTKGLGLAILATAVSSPSINGTYWFNANGSYQQTLVEPRVYLSILHFGVSVGLNLTEGSSGTVQAVASYGGMAGIELPLGAFSLGVDARYLFNSENNNQAPLATIAMFRFRL